MTNELIPQKHGGALLPFTPARGAAAGRSSMKAIRKAGLALLATGTEEAAQVMLEALKSADERVRVIAAQQIMDRVLGRPGEKPQGDDEHQAYEMDLSGLSDEELAVLSRAVGQQLLPQIVAQTVKVGGPVIEGDSSVALPPSTRWPAET